jgi:hypothetical protein
MNGHDGNHISADVEVCGIRERGIEASAWSSTLAGVVEADSWRIAEGEVAIDLSQSQGKAQENGIDLEHCDVAVMDEWDFRL